MPENEDDGFTEYDEEYKRNELLYKQTLLGLEYWEYAWVRPGKLSAYGADRWRVVYMTPWWKGKVLMERKLLLDDVTLTSLSTETDG